MKINGVKKRDRINIILVSIASLIAGVLFSRTTTNNDIIIGISGGVVGLIIGGAIVTLETYFSPWVSRKFSFIITILVKSLIYSIIILSTLTLNITTLISIGYYDMTIRTYFNENSFTVSIIFSIILTVFFITMFQINDLIGRGFLIKFFLGKYHTPREEERIFMFIDLKNSTGLAEKLGDIKFLSLINDFLSDLTNPVLSTGGEIYKYVGDEAIVSWSYKKGVKNDSAIKSFFYFLEVIESRKEYYINQYGVIPRFKGGVHGGRVVTGEIGLSKKEITYLGDVLNTTARIEGLCNILNEDLLISEVLFNSMEKPQLYTSKEYKERAIRGKEESITLYSLKIIK